MTSLSELHEALDKRADYAVGLPSRQDLGDLSRLRAGQLIDWIVQHHDAIRSGKHYDVRFGTPDTGLFSWATKHELPEPGKRRALFQQPVHRFGYGDFEGVIPKGYGAGTVRRHDKGKILVTQAGPGKIEFVLAHRRHPERFALIRPEGWKDKDWLLINTTPREPVPYEKVHYKKVPAEQVDKYIDQMQQGDSLETKIDGASSLIALLKDRVELVSYRTSKETGRPIVHTERFFGGPGKMQIPAELVGTVLKGELYGLRRRLRPGGVNRGAGAVGAGPGHRDDDAAGTAGQGVIPPQELGGLLNSSLAESLRKQQEGGVQLRNMIYDIQRFGQRDIDWHEVPRPARRRMIEQVLAHLPADKFHISPAATTPERARELWQGVQSKGYSPGNEGVILHRQHGPPLKSKLVEDEDVYVTGFFPGEGRLAGHGVGGFTYSRTPGGPTVGRVGTGLSDALRADLANDPEAYVGRAARIQAQHAFPSGAFRAPALIALHEDYDQKQAGVAADLAKARRETDTNPSEAQKEQGNYKKGKIRLHGLTISIENPKGSTRAGIDKDGKRWESKMHHDYGYILGTVGRDKDHLDIFIGPDPDLELVYVVNQQDTGSGKFDEHKILVGWGSEEEARRGYLANYQKGWDGLASIAALTLSQFHWWLEHGDTTKPIEDGMFAKHRKAASLAALHAGIDFIPANEKSAQIPQPLPYYQRGLIQQLHSPVWSPDSNWATNMMANLRMAKERAQRQVQEQDSLNDLRSTLEPGFALHRFQQYINQGDHVQDPVDQALFRGVIF